MPLNASSSNRTQVAYKLEGTYPTNFGVIQGGNGALMNITSESLDFNIDTTQSKIIQATRQAADIVQTGAGAGGSISTEHIYRDLDTFIAGVVQSDFVTYGTNGVSAAISITTAGPTTGNGGTITAGTAPTGNDAFTNLKKGQWISITVGAGASAKAKAYYNSRAFRVSTQTPPTATVITLDESTKLSTVAADGAINTFAGSVIGTSYVMSGSALKTYTLEVGHLDIGQYRQYYGMAPSKMDLKIAAGEIVTASFEFKGNSGDLKQATGMGTPTAAAAFTPANAVKGVVDIYEAGAPLQSANIFIKSADITVDNALRDQTAVGIFGLAGLGNGTQKVTGKMEMYFSDAAMFNKFKNGDVSSLSVPVLDINGNGYVYHFPRIKYTAAKIATQGLDQDNMINIEWQGFAETDAASAWVGKSVVVFRVGA